VQHGSPFFASNAHLTQDKAGNLHLKATEGRAVLINDVDDDAIQAALSSTQLNTSRHRLHAAQQGGEDVKKSRCSTLKMYHMRQCLGVDK